MTKDRELIQEIVERAPAVAKPDKIILFGSAATGKMTPDSDIDLLVIEPEPTDTLSLWEVCV
jgi:predicted nucleotidyltransferase